MADFKKIQIINETGTTTEVMCKDEAVRESIAPVFSTTTTYAIGDYIYYNNKLYRFTAAHSAGAWNTSQVTAVTVGSDKANKSDVNTALNAKANSASPSFTGTPTIAAASVSAWRDALKCECLVVSCGTISSLPATISNANVESDMVVLQSVLGTPSAQTGDWTVTTASGSLTISGSISGSTTLTLYLMQSR